MPFDPLVTNPGRLMILTTLAASGPQEFVHLRRATKLSDGNLATHARRLQDGGLIVIHKEIRAGKPVTHFALKTEGRVALESHARELMTAIGGTKREDHSVSKSSDCETDFVQQDEEWID